MTFASGISRRAFLGGLAGLSAKLTLGAESSEASAAEGAVRFLLCSDLHLETVPWGREAKYGQEGTIPTLLRAASEQACDFIMNLGDFTMPSGKGNPTECLKAWFDTTVFAGERYVALGNHDVELDTKATCLERYRMPGKYYAFDRGGWHFVVLDPQNIRLEDGSCVAYDGKQSGSGYSFTQRSFVDDAQLAWLREDLMAAKGRCLIFSHQSVEQYIGNGAAVRATLEAVNQAAGYRKVVAVFGGHNHSNRDLSLGGIRYIQINSASYAYVGSGAPKAETRYKEAYPDFTLSGYSTMLNSSYPYRKVLYAIVEADATCVRVHGFDAGFVAPLPTSVLQPNNLPMASWIRDAEILV